MELLKTLSEKGKLCSGCGACSNICPVQAIEMQPDAQGFLYPHIKDNCISCGQCVAVCPKLHPLHDYSSEPECYAARASDDIRRSSSSGGIFTVLANWVFRNGGVVCGAAMEKDYSVHHICITEIEELPRLQQSKYVQSNTEQIYREAVRYLKEGRPVLFTGCPCQIAAMRSFAQLKKVDTTQLYCVDILCHGVPSQQMWQDYVRENFDPDQLETIEFRSKLNGWRADQLRVFWKDTSSTAVLQPDSAYVEGFLRNITLRDGCGDCSFCGFPRQGDITLGDYWGIEKYDSTLSDNKGTSVILITSSKGRDMLNEIRADLLDIQETPLRAAAKYNRMSPEYKFHPMHQRFKSLYPGHSFTAAVMQVCHRRFDIGLVGPYYFPNYGSQLTYYALYQALTDLGYSVLMIERPLDCALSGKRNMFQTSPYPKYALSKQYANIADMKNLNRACKTFVLGSDQILNYNAYVLYGKYTVLNFVTDNHRKIAYAASWGHDRIWGEESDRAEESYFLRKFDAFSVREDAAVALVKREFGVDADWVLDPVFICNTAVFEKMANQYQAPVDNFIFTYFLNMPGGVDDLLSKYADSNNWSIYTLLGKWPRFGFSELSKAWHIIKNDSIEAWLSMIRNSQFFLCDSFHGVCFALIFRREFLVMVDKNSGEARLRSILRLVGLEDRMVYSVEQFKKKIEHMESIDYDRVSKILDKERAYSLQWLKNAIETDKDVRKPLSEFDILDGRLDFLAQQNAQLQEEVQRLSRELGYASKRRMSSKFLWLRKKIQGGIRCWQEHGFSYTWKHFWGKVRRKLAK